MEIKCKDEMKYSDQIKEHLMDYIYSDDSVEDADHLESIFHLLSLMDIQIRDLENNRKYYQRQYMDARLKLHRYESNEESSD